MAGKKYDDATKRFVGVPPDLGARASGACGPLDFDATGRYFIAGKSVCDAALQCKPLRATPVGWLDEGARFLID